MFIDAVEAEERVRGTLQPYKKEDCEVNKPCCRRDQVCI